MSESEIEGVTPEEESHAREVALDIVMLQIAHSLGDESIEDSARQIAEQMCDPSTPLYAGGQFATIDEAVPVALTLILMTDALLEEPEEDEED